jgi:hypothetical protein
MQRLILLRWSDLKGKARMKRQTIVFLFLLALLAALAACRTDDPVVGLPTPIIVQTPVVTGPTATATAPTQPPTPTLQATATTTAPATEPAASPTAAPTATTPPTTVPSATPTSAATAPPTAPPGTQRISFAAGAISAFVQDVVNQGEQDRYVLWVQQGQTIQLRLSSLEESGTLMILDPAGNTLNPGGGGPGTIYQVEQWSGQAATSGDYTIVVSSVMGSATYRLEVVIPPLTTGDPTATERVQFEPGMSGIILRGSLPEGLSKSYVLRAMQDQWMSVSVYASTNNPFLTISGADGAVFVRSALGQTSWYIPALPSTQDYTITVLAANGPADYALDIGLSALSDQPTRVEFAPGSSSATLIGRLAAGGDAEYYIFRALAGQTVTVSGAPAGSPLFVYLTSADGSSFFGGAESLSAQLTATTDYVLTIGSPNAAGTVDFNMTLTIE